LISNWIYRFTSFFRCRYAFCLHRLEHILRSRRFAVNSSLQGSQNFLRSWVFFLRSRL
jgi:hypothetical protein